MVAESPLATSRASSRMQREAVKDASALRAPLVIGSVRHAEPVPELSHENGPFHPIGPKRPGCKERASTRIRLWPEQGSGSEGGGWQLGFPAGTVDFLSELALPKVQGRWYGKLGGLWEVGVVESDSSSGVGGGQKLSHVKLGVKLSTKGAAATYRGQVGSTPIQLGGAKGQASIAKTPGSLAPLVIRGVQPRQATETSTDALVEVGEALELGSGRGAAHAVNHAAMPATGAKQAKANLSGPTCWWRPKAGKLPEPDAECGQQRRHHPQWQPQAAQSCAAPGSHRDRHGARHQVGEPQGSQDPPPKWWPRTCPSWDAAPCVGRRLGCGRGQHQRREHHQQSHRHPDRKTPGRGAHHGVPGQAGAGRKRTKAGPKDHLAARCQWRASAGCRSGAPSGVDSTTSPSEWELGSGMPQCREIKLKAFLKSSLTRTLPPLPWFRSYQHRAACTAASAPLGTATPSLTGAKNCRASSFTVSIKHLAVKRRKTSPTAIGRTPPVGLGRATRLAPAKLGATAGQAFPCASKLTTPQSCWRKASVEPAAQASRKCWTRPEGPGAVSGGKLRKARATRSGTTSGAKGWEASSGVVGGCWVGWRAWRARSVSSVWGLSPVDRRAAHAFRSKPSRARAIARDFFSSSEGGLEGLPRRGCPRDSHKLSLSPACQRCRRSRV